MEHFSSFLLPLALLLPLLPPTNPAHLLSFTVSISLLEQANPLEAEEEEEEEEEEVKEGMIKCEQ